MHNKKWSRNVKKALSITMTSLMLLPSVVNAMPDETTYNFNEESFINSQLSISLIQEGVDITTEEEISVIVEFKEMPTAYATKVGKLSKTNSNSAIKKEHEEFEKFINGLKLDDKKTYSADKNIKYNYTNTFNGVALNIKGTDVEKLLDCGVVKNIWPDNEVKVELPKEIETKEKQEIEPYMENSVPHLGVDKLHEEGIKGNDIKIGVIDTGIDYNHPDLKENYKGGYDFVNNDDDPMETNLEDWKGSGYPEHHPISGSSYYTSHGTHVSGTVAANGNNKDSEFATVGIAPEADLYAYKVLGPYGSGQSADVLAGIEKAVNDGMDVINLSLGANTNDPLYPTSVACNNAMLAGVITVVANGNSGPNTGTVGAPAAAALPISVGASSVDMKVQTFDVNGLGVSENGRVIARDFDTKLEMLNGENKLVDCGLGKVNDFKDKEVEGKIALIERGELSFNEKIINAKNVGAKSIIIYNNVDGPITVNLGENSQFIPTIGITKESGNKIKEALEKGEEAKISLQMGKVEVSQGDELADFSSRGPVINENIKPDVVAPGVSIFSTYPEFINDKDANKEDYSKAYARINGTSMASPHVAGVAALIKSQNENYDPFDVKVALMNTSDDLRHEYGVHEVGSGKIDPSQAIKSGISIRTEQEDKTISQDGEIELIKHETASLSFGRATNIDKTIKMEKELLIDNYTNKTNTFDVSVDYITPNKTNNVKDAEKNKVKLNVKETATANKNTQTKLKTTLTIPKNAEFGVYQGYVKLQNKKNKGEVYQMPFSVNYTKAGIESAVLTRNAISNDVDWFNPFLENGIHMQLTMNQYVEKIDFIVRDFETQEVIGYIGTI
ncbi:MAG: S8 family serine peptidase, partial [Romboutsia sp.]|uniref:S8 family serine peptidase n=1 Tax=Romboutsia sp. TaxID=1965302 RepID=UPI003F3CF7E8